MAPIVHSVEISRSPEVVSSALVDVARFHEWQESLVSARVLGEGPLGRGSRVSNLRRLGPITLSMDNEITDYDPPRSYAFRGLDGPVRVTGRGTLEPVGDGDRTRFTLELEFEGHGSGKLLLPLVRLQARRELAASNVKLKGEVGARLVSADGHDRRNGRVRLGVPPSAPCGGHRPSHPRALRR